MDREQRSNKILWQLPFPSSWGGGTKLIELPQRSLALMVEGGDEGDLRITFQQVEAYKCTYYLARTDEMLIAYDRLVDMAETDWLIRIRDRLQDHGVYLSAPSGPPNQLKHLMINFDDGPCYEFICQSFDVEQIATDPERWR